MFVSDELKAHLETSNVVRAQTAIIAEWNMNIATNIFRVGNYRFRPHPSDSTSNYAAVAGSFDTNDSGYFYTNATNADTVIDGGISDDGQTPLAFKSAKDKDKLLYSLEDCFNRFRPRSGINKLRYFEGKFSHYTNVNMVRRPRYYMSHKDDNFKYWSSYREEPVYKYVKTLGATTETFYGPSPKYVDYDMTEKDGVLVNSEVHGISRNYNGQFYINDANPFVVYKEAVPANRVVVKMQTNVGEVDLGPFSNSSGVFNDPFYGDANKTTPVKWSIQKLTDNNSWVDIASFNNQTKRLDGSEIIKSDGYVELAYGLVVPEKYRSIFIKAEEYPSVDFLPEQSVNGYAYLIKTSDSDVGNFHIWVNNGWEIFQAKYEWYLAEEGLDRLTNFAKDLVSPETFTSVTDGASRYREFENINGLRVVVETMNRADAILDLIELSPRLAVDLSDKTTSFSLSKSASDLSNSGLPVGQLLAGTGSVELFDYDLAFSKTNSWNQATGTGSIVANHTSKNIQFKFYEIIVDVDGWDYYVPIKTMYSEGFPEVKATDRQTSIELRDMFFYFESHIAPQILIQNASLSYAISMLLDSVGFSNYVFKRLAKDSDPVIPYFYIAPDKTVAQVLNDLAISTQTAMFFDEYNNFVMMGKSYFLAEEGARVADATLRGSQDQSDTGVVNNKTTSEKLANIIDIVSEDDKVYNDGKILYSTKYIQRSYGSLRQASMIDQNKTWVYKPALLWEVTGTENTKSINEEVGTMSNYVLSAIPLKEDLSNKVPYIENNKIKNNIVNFGEGVYWLSRYNGYFYANGEIIKYDAVEYQIPGTEVSSLTETSNGKITETSQTVGNIGTVWITSVQEYQRYFSKISFNGKMYPTGRVRIYTEPNYVTVDGILKLASGLPAKHGRGQFGTPVVTHYAGLADYWSNNDNVRGVDMNASYLFNAPARQTFDNATSASTTLLNLSTTVGIKVGDKISLVSGTGQFNTSASTYVKSVISATQIELTSAVAVLLNNAVVATEQELTISEGAAGVNNTLAKKTTRTGLIKNFLTYTPTTENTTENKDLNPGSIQSSALVMTGPSFSTTEKPTDFVSYVYKKLDDKFKHFGTRARIVGRIENSLDNGQTGVGASAFYEKDGTVIQGASGGLAVMINPTTNNGYYFEIAALSENNVNQYSGDDEIHNMMFYKIVKDVSNPAKAVPVKLWGGLGKVVVDDGRFTGQYRMAGETTPTVYDLAVEYRDIGKIRRFFLYVNNRLVATVDDTDPLTASNNMALFVRGSARMMFENIYAVTNNYSQNTVYDLDMPTNAVFADEEINVNEAFRKYSMSGVIQGTYLSGISPSEPPAYKLYFEEFGTIMREASYFNIKYDKAYPALYAKLSPTFNRIKGYTVSGFLADAYGAEFMVFNATDTALSLDETSGNYLRIQGITFTQESQHELGVDEYFSKKSDFSNPIFEGTTLVSSPIKVKQEYYDIKNSRITHGRQEFSLETPYVQSQDAAQELMGWLVSKVMKPRKSVGVSLFAMPTLQLGDIVTIDYKDAESVNQVTDPSTRFVVYQIEYSRDGNGPSMTAYLSEVS